MADRGTVIKELARCVSHGRECEKCFYRNETFCTEALMYDAMELLKEQAEQIERLEHDLAITEGNLAFYINGND